MRNPSRTAQRLHDLNKPLSLTDGCISAARKREGNRNRHIPLNFNEQNFDRRKPL